MTVLGLPQIAIIARLVRGNMVEVLHSNYVRTARERIAEYTRGDASCMRAALLPLVSYPGRPSRRCSPARWLWKRSSGCPASGAISINGAQNRDYTLVMGVVIVYAALIIVLNLVTDLLYAVLDPRVRLTNDCHRGICGKRGSDDGIRSSSGRSLWGALRAGGWSNKAAVVGMVVLAIIALMAIFVPLIW